MLNRQESESTQDLFSLLSQEIIFKIFRFLTSEELFNLCVVSSCMRDNAIHYDEIWKRKIQNEFPKVEPTWYGFYDTLFTQDQAEKKVKKEQEELYEKDPHQAASDAIYRALFGPDSRKRMSNVIRNEHGLSPLPEDLPLKKRVRRSP